MTNRKNFFSEHFNLGHIVGMILCALLAILYWYKAGRFSEFIIKNNLILTILWGLGVGYVAMDLVISSWRRNKK